jgi:hypothetical protein
MPSSAARSESMAPGPDRQESLKRFKSKDEVPLPHHPPAHPPAPHPLPPPPQCTPSQLAGAAGLDFRGPASVVRGSPGLFSCFRRPGQMLLCMKAATVFV